MSKYKYGICQKCQTIWLPVYEYNGRWLCKDNLCFFEEQEKDSEKHIRDEEKLEEYRRLVAGTKDIPATHS